MIAHRPAWLLAAVLAAGCGANDARTSPPAAALSERAPPAIASSLQSVSSSKPGNDVSAAGEKSLAIPAVPAGADPEDVRIASSICAATYLVEDRDGKSRTLVGCRRPPPFEGPGRAPDGKIPLHQGERSFFCGFDIVHRGSFDRAGTEQAVLSMENCQDDDGAGWNGSVPGRAVLVEKVGERWRAVSYEPDVNADQCKAVRRRDGRDVLLCQSRYDASVGTMIYFFLIDFARASKHSATVAWLLENAETWGACQPASAEPLAPSGLVSVRVQSVALTDRNKDGVSDLIVDVERARATPSTALETKLRALCSQQKPPDGALPRATKFRLELVSEGDGFAPTKASKRLLDAWENETPDVLQLRGAAPPPLEP